MAPIVEPSTVQPSIRPESALMSMPRARLLRIVQLRTTKPLPSRSAFAMRPFRPNPAGTGVSSVSS